MRTVGCAQDRLSDGPASRGGAAAGSLPLANGTDILRGPRYAELAEEILCLSTEFGVLSEYTPFLAAEGTDLASWDALLLSCKGLTGTSRSRRAA